MWFKNLQLYRIGAMTPAMLAALTDGLVARQYSPLGSNETLRHGWAEPIPGAGLVHVVQGQMLLRLDTEARVVPGHALNREAKARADKLEEEQGHRPGKKAMRELKERVHDELLPRAFPRLTSTFVWIDPAAGWLVIDSASTTGADTVIKELLRTADKLPVTSLRVQRSPVGMMTAWLESDEAPPYFTVDQDAELRATGESRAAVRWVKHTLDVDELRRHIAAGKQCTRLAMTWKSRVSFVLTEALEIKAVRPLDVIREGEVATADDRERFDNDFMLMTGELRGLLFDLVHALGGLTEA